MKKSINTLLGTIVCALFYTSCVSGWHAEGNYDVTRSKLPLHNLAYYCPKDSNAEDFKRAEFGLKPFTMNSMGKEMGYYYLDFKKYEFNGNLCMLLGACTLGIYYLLAPLGAPTDSANPTVYATMYIFDSNGDYIMQIEGKGEKTQLASLWYGHTINEDKVASKAFQEISDSLSTVGYEINRKLEAAGPIDNKKEPMAKEKIRKYFGSNKSAVLISTTTSSSASLSPSVPVTTQNTNNSLKDGLYALSGTNVKMRISSITNLVSLNGDSGSGGIGSSRISNNKLIVSFSTCYGDFAGLNGKTVTYGIKDSETFYGNGTSWSWIGY